MNFDTSLKTDVNDNIEDIKYGIGDICHALVLSGIGDLGKIIRKHNNPKSDFKKPVSKEDWKKLSDYAGSIIELTGNLLDKGELSKAKLKKIDQLEEIAINLQYVTDFMHYRLG